MLILHLYTIIFFFCVWEMGKRKWKWWLSTSSSDVICILHSLILKAKLGPMIKLTNIYFCLTMQLFTKIHKIMSTYFLKLESAQDSGSTGSPFRLVWIRKSAIIKKLISKCKSSSYRKIFCPDRNITFIGNGRK